jgi:hypothetical protein
VSSDVVRGDLRSPQVQVNSPAENQTRVFHSVTCHLAIASA